MGSTRQLLSSGPPSASTRTCIRRSIAPVSGLRLPVKLAVGLMEIVTMKSFTRPPDASSAFT